MLFFIFKAYASFEQFIVVIYALALHETPLSQQDFESSLPSYVKYLYYDFWTTNY